jgi:hypothetical protein
MKKMRMCTVPAVPAKEVEEQIAIICDLCQAESPCRTHWLVGSSGYSGRTVVVSIQDQSSFPEGGTVKRHSFDLCPKCFWEKLVPWMEQQGAKPRVMKRDW